MSELTEALDVLNQSMLRDGHLKGAITVGKAAARIRELEEHQPDAVAGLPEGYEEVAASYERAINEGMPDYDQTQAEGTEADRG